MRAECSWCVTEYSWCVTECVQWRQWVAQSESTSSGKARSARANGVTTWNCLKARSARANGVTTWNFLKARSARANGVTTWNCLKARSARANGVTTWNCLKSRSARANGVTTWNCVEGNVGETSQRRDGDIILTATRLWIIVDRSFGTPRSLEILSENSLEFLVSIALC